MMYENIKENINHIFRYRLRCNLYFFKARHHDDVLWKKRFSRYGTFVWGPSGTGGFLCYVGLNGKCLPWRKHEQSVEQAVKLSVIWDAMTLMWRHCNV